MEERIWHQHYDHSVLKDYRFPRLAVQDLVAIPANAFPEKTAVNYYGNEITFSALRNQIFAMSTVLNDMGIKKGDRVGIHLPNMPEYIITFYATLSLGAIAVNFNPLYTAEELTALIELTSVSAFITFDMGVPVIKEVCKTVEIPNVIAASVFDSMGGEKSAPQSMNLEEGWHHMATLLENCTDPRRSRIEVQQEDPALIQFTGGTTGIPKGAVLTHANLIAATYSTTHWGSPTIQYSPIETRNVLCALPFFHVYGNILCMNWAMINCATMILIPRFEIEEFINLIASFDKITFFPAVPTMINAVINHPKTKELELGNKIGLLNSGGAPLPTELIEQAKDLNFIITEGWGMSETTSLGTSNPNLGKKKTGSIGIPFPGMDVKLVDLEDGATEVPPGQPGELVVKGPMVMKEYWNNPDKTREELKDGWLYTGDIAKMDKEGYLFIVDRKKDLIIAGGFNIYPRDIDEVLYQHPKIAEAVAVGVQDAYRGETVKAFIVLKENQTATEQEIVDFCKQKLAVYKVPKIIEFRSELPTSAIGKVLRKTLREEENAKLHKTE